MLHRSRHGRAAALSFGQLLGVHGAGLVLVKAIFERVLKMVEPEEIRAATVRPVQKRAVIAHVAHFLTRANGNVRGLRCEISTKRSKRL
jgi:hypothetical protein